MTTNSKVLVFASVAAGLEQLSTTTAQWEHLTQDALETLERNHPGNGWDGDWSQALMNDLGDMLLARAEGIEPGGALIPLLVDVLLAQALGYVEQHADTNAPSPQHADAQILQFFISAVNSILLRWFEQRFESRAGEAEDTATTPTPNAPGSPSHQ